MGEDGFAIQTTSDGGYLVGGRAWSNDGDLTEHKAKSDCWVVKLSPAPVSSVESPTINAIGHLETYPNPTHHTINIKAPSDESVLNIRITDLLGREILQQSMTNGEGVDVSSFSNGMYLIIATTPSGKVFFDKIWKE